MNLNVRRIEKTLAVREITQKKLAEMSGLYRQNISVILKRGTCTPVTAGKIAKALDVDIEEIIQNPEEMQRKRLEQR